MNVPVLTIDTGGTKTRLVQFETKTDCTADTANVKIQTEFPTPRGQSAYTNHLVKAIRQTFTDFLATGDLKIISLATRGVITGRSVSDDMLDWHDFRIADSLAETFNCQVLLENDARVGALGAFGLGFSGRGLYIAMGAGVGAGMVIDGQLSDDLSSIEVGKMLLRQTDGNFVKWEDLASGAAFANQFGTNSEIIPVNSPAWRQYAADLNTGLYALLPVLRPDKIVLGGALAACFDKFSDYLLRSDKSAPLDKRFFNVKLAAATEPRYTVNRGALIFAELQQANRVRHDH
jgi:predicted NBD/HSP70 family sugar kinase